MIRRFLISCVVCCLSIGPAAIAADLPSGKTPQKQLPLKASTKPRQIVAKPRPTPVRLDEAAIQPLPAVTGAVSNETQEPMRQDTEAGSTDGSFDMVWVLDPLVATVDSFKKEGSASVEGNLIVAEPSQVALPAMVIELSGHIVKTPQTTVRLDVHVGGTSRSVSWNRDDVQSGRFNIELNAPMKAGKLPSYIPVSALAFVTREGKEGTAMVSLDKVVVRLGKASLAAQ
jgi:hypothetical protein